MNELVNKLCEIAAQHIEKDGEELTDATVVLLEEIQCFIYLAEKSETQANLIRKLGRNIIGRLEREEEPGVSAKTHRLLRVMRLIYQGYMVKHY